MSAPASKIKEQKTKLLYFLAKILYITNRGQGKNRLISLREVLKLAIRIRAEQARA
jgi:hypothetical protein